MTCLEIITLAQEATGDLSSEALDYGRRALRMKYATLYDTHSWREAQRMYSAQMDSTLGGAFFLPFDAEEVISLSLSYDGQNYIRLTYRERDWIERFVAPVYTLPGNSAFFYRAENLAWPAISPGQITFASAEPAPVTVYISGRDANNFPISETLVLQGINTGSGFTPTSIQTANSYQFVTAISKTLTTTPLSISDGVRTAAMAPATTELIFTQIVIFPTPLFSGPIYLRTVNKLKPDPLSNDMSVPRISHVWEALVCFTKSALYERMQQVAKAQQANQDGMAHVQAAVGVEKNQSESRQQAVPVLYDASPREDGDYWRW
jgi:hypothetical protein